MPKNEKAQKRRKMHIRKKVNGSAERPRLTVFRSNKYIYAQVVDDLARKTLAASGGLSKDLKGQDGNKIEKAKSVGKAIAEACLEKGVKKVVFDRNGYLYHGRVKALADAAREAGLDF